MEDDEKILFDNIEFISNLSETKSVFLVRDKLIGALYVQKTLKFYDVQIYDYLMSHPIKNTPKIINVKYDGDDLVVLEEYIDGMTLTEYLEYLKNKNDITKSDEKKFYDFLYKLCDIINNLHTIKPNIIHRDVKPDNIIITPNDDIYLIDMNSAKFYEKDEEKDTHILGTVNFAAPEQYMGNAVPESDIYAIGAVMKNCIDSFDDNDLKKKLNSTINKCMMIDYDDRFNNITELKLSIFKSQHNIFFLAIPGYRTMNIYHMILATSVYICLIYNIFINTYINKLSLNIMTVFLILMPLWTFYDYLGICRLMPLCKSKNMFINLCGKCILSILIFILYTFIIIII